MLIAGTDLIGPRSDFAAFGMKRIPYLFFSHATHKDYHGAGDKPELLNYAKMAQDAALIEAMVREIAALRTRPVFREPVYPAAETTTLLAIMKAIRTEKKELPRAYQLVFKENPDG
jgi:hypothetical protein